MKIVFEKIKVQLELGSIYNDNFENFTNSEIKGHIRRPQMKKFSIQFIDRIEKY